MLNNQRPERLPLYEHHIDTPFIEKITRKKICIEGNKPKDYKEYYRQIIGFWKDMTYDTFDYEAAICDIFPGHGAIMGGMLGPIQTRDDFNKNTPLMIFQEYLGKISSMRIRNTLT